jgi:hypothetical protein
MITVTLLDGTEIDIQTSAVILARDAMSSEDASAESVLVYKTPNMSKPFREIQVQETTTEIAALDALLFLTDDLAPDGEVITLVRNQERVVGTVDNAADPVQYLYNQEGFEVATVTHNGDYASFIAQFDGSYSPASPSPSASASSPSGS